MKTKHYLSIIMSIIVFNLNAQDYTSYFTGNQTNMDTIGDGGICLMGGATENDEAMKWFLNRCNGGDVLVLRASGSDGYNDYFYSELGVDINSVETIVFHNANASNDTTIHNKIKQAEAIWIAGGDQWKYVSYWKNTPIDSLIRDAYDNQYIAIGGTSAGMAILGSFYYTAQFESITSEQALSNPYNTNLTVDSSLFIANSILQDVITDTHYDNPDRKGRHVSFLANIFSNYGIFAKGIACDEYTSVCILPHGIAKVYGNYPTYDDNAYFIQANCELQDYSPEICTQGNPLTWNRNNLALKVYQVNGNMSATNTFDLNTWQDGQGGQWQDWYVINGQLFQTNGEAIDCTVSRHEEKNNLEIYCYPNPASNYLYFENLPFNCSFEIYNIQGSLIFSGLLTNKLNITKLKRGLYLIKIKSKDQSLSKIIRKQ